MHAIVTTRALIFLLPAAATAAPAKTAKAAPSAAARPLLKPLKGAVAKVYKTVDGWRLQVHIFFPKGHRPDEKRPAMVFFFGGGWIGGSPGHFRRQAQHLADLGMVAVCPEYRTRNRCGTPPFACVEDGKSAMRWVRAHAAELGIDPNRIAAGGGSAGGHVAACTAFIPGFDAPDDDVTVSPVPNALVLFNPVIDTTKKGYGWERLGDRMTDVSPVHHVKANAPPTIVFHGTADTTVPFENVQRFQKLMKEKGNRCELIPFEGGRHGFFNRGADYARCVELMDRFLADLGYLHPPEKKTAGRVAGAEHGERAHE